MERAVSALGWKDSQTGSQMEDLAEMNQAHAPGPSGPPPASHAVRVYRLSWGVKSACLSLALPPAAP